MKKSIALSIAVFCLMLSNVMLSSLMLSNKVNAGPLGKYTTSNQRLEPQQIQQQTVPTTSRLPDLEKELRVQKLLAELPQEKRLEWLAAYNKRLAQALDSGKIEEARYYRRILKRWEDGG